MHYFQYLAAFIKHLITWFKWQSSRLDCSFITCFQVLIDCLCQVRERIMHSQLSWNIAHICHKFIMTIAQFLIKYLSRKASVNCKNFGQARRKLEKLVNYAKNSADCLECVCERGRERESRGKTQINATTNRANPPSSLANSTWLTGLPSGWLQRSQCARESKREGEEGRENAEQLMWKFSKEKRKNTHTHTYRERQLRAASAEKTQTAKENLCEKSPANWSDFRTN